MTLKLPAKLVLGSLVICVVSGSTAFLALAGIAGCVTGGGCNDRGYTRILDISSVIFLASIVVMVIGSIWAIVSAKRAKAANNGKPVG